MANAIFGDVGLSPSWQWQYLVMLDCYFLWQFTVGSWSGHSPVVCPKETACYAFPVRNRQIFALRTTENWMFHAFGCQAGSFSSYCVLHPRLAQRIVVEVACVLVVVVVVVVPQ